MELTNKIVEIQQNLDERDRLELPIIETFDDSEYPETNFQTDVESENVENNEEINENRTEAISQRNFNGFVRNEDDSDNCDILDLDLDKLLELSSNEQIASNWELEMHQKSYQRRFIEQQQLIDLINTKINNFNQKLIELNEESIIVEINSNFLKHFILTINQELSIIKHYKELEENSQHILERNRRDLLELKNSVDDCRDRMQKYQQELHEFFENFENLQDEGGIDTAIQEKLTIIDKLKENLDDYFKKMEIVENSTKATHDDLERYRIERKEKLNKINVIVVLQLEQIQNLDDETTDIDNIMESLVISNEELTKLSKRVDELQAETESLKKSHLPKIRHLRRISRDLKFMDKHLEQLKSEMSELIRKQFGYNINIEQIQNNLLRKHFVDDIFTDFEKLILKKYVHDLNSAGTDLKEMYKHELNLLKGDVERTQNELKTMLQENTQRQELLKMLLKEKIELRKLLEIQPKKRENIINIEKSIDCNRKEIRKFETIIEKQNYEICELKYEIKQLKTKCELPPKICKRKLPIIKTEIEEEIGEEESFIQYQPQISSENIVRSLLDEMWMNLEIQLNEKSKENLVKTILSDILNQFDIYEIVNDLINNLPVEISDEKYSFIAEIIEKLITICDIDIQRSAEDGDLERYCREILDDLLNEIPIDQEPIEIISSFINQLTTQLPVDFIRRKSSMDSIIGRFCELSINEQIDTNQLENKIGNRLGCEIMKEILENVYKQIDPL